MQMLILKTIIENRILSYLISSPMILIKIIYFVSSKLKSVIIKLSYGKSNDFILVT